MDDIHSGQSTDETHTDTELIATFMLGDALFGIDAKQIQEVVKLGDITAVHHAPAYVVGIRNLRGKIITVLDLSVRLDLGTVEPGPETRILIIEWRDEPIGLMVDRVADTIETEKSAVETAPPNLHGVQSRHLRGVCRSGSRLVALLDPDTILTPDEVAGSETVKETSVL